MKRKTKLIVMLSIIVLDITGLTHWMIETVEANEPKVVELNMAEKTKVFDTVISHYGFEDVDDFHLVSTHKIKDTTLVIIEHGTTDYFLEFVDGQVVRSGVHG